MMIKRQITLICTLLFVTLIPCRTLGSISGDSLSATTSNGDIFILYRVNSGNKKGTFRLSRLNSDGQLSKITRFDNKYFFKLIDSPNIMMLRANESNIDYLKFIRLVEDITTYESKIMISNFRTYKHDATVKNSKIYECYTFSDRIEVSLEDKVEKIKGNFDSCKFISHNETTYLLAIKGRSYLIYSLPSINHIDTLENTDKLITSGGGIFRQSGNSIIKYESLQLATDSRGQSVHRAESNIFDFYPIHGTSEVVVAKQKSKDRLKLVYNNRVLTTLGMATEVYIYKKNERLLLVYEELKIQGQQPTYSINITFVNQTG